MVRHCYVTGETAKYRLQSNVAAYLARLFVTVAPEQFDQFVT